ncbi:uncharacterized protein FTOL_05270 [Fusarium torulosum]|uniref:Uncharacterized protein n=1 Tax=Fusarium torulosum TaxID=33205 RepID=A0AAE8SHP2_9HYPO|nr:uncharacterized protein FTOL_05270 [Fusarium torulosum]
MSNDQYVNGASQALSSPEITTTRPRQESKLALLPVEILLQITGEPGKDEDALSAKDFKDLALSCSTLFDYARPMYYLASNYSVFHIALQHGDIDTIKRCAQFDAAPDTKWELSQPCKCRTEAAHQHHRPVDVLLERVVIGCVPIDKCVEVLRWLLENGYEASEQGDQHWWEANDYCDHMPELVVTLLKDSVDQASTEGIFQMIQLLRSHGRSLPFHMNLYDNAELATPYKALSLIRKPMDVALRSHCPVEFLEVVLQEYQNRQIDVKVWHSHSSPKLERWVGQYHTIISKQCWRFQSTNVGDLIWGLFQDLADPITPWKETYHGEAADIFERKIKLLVKYQFIEAHEEKLLQSVLQALRDIAESAEIQRIVPNRDGKAYWTRLVDSLRPHAASEDLLANHIYPDGMGWTTQSLERTHRFIVEEKWDPYDLWFSHELQEPSVRNSYSHPWTSLRGFSLWQTIWTGKFFDPEWDRILIFREIEDMSADLPAWYNTTYDEFVDAVERLWEKRNPKLDSDDE